MTYRIHFLALLLLLGLAGPGCDPPVDDDDTVDDDDDDDTADDDDATGDDDDDDFAETTFAGTLDVTLQVGDDDDSSGDDDDSSGDDDDSASGDDDDSASGDDDDSASGDDDDSASGGTSARSEATVSGTFVVRYWQNLDAQLLGCDQTMAWTGTASFDFGVLSPECDTCSGRISVDPNSVEDVSSSDTDDGCTSDDLANVAENWGDALTNEENGFAWLEMPLLDVATAQGLGLQPTDGVTLQETIDGLAGGGLELTHIGFVETVDSVFGPNGFNLPSAGANPPEAGAGFGAFWTVFKDPAQNQHPAGISLEGSYFLGSFWLLQ